jgi:hypothetical protein
MQHFDAQNRHEIPDAKPRMWATVLFSDTETLSELSRHGFHLVDMSNQVWVLRRAM